MSNQVTVALIQMDCVLEDKEHNLEHAAKLIAKAAARDASLIVLPELFSTGYRVEPADYELAESIPGATTDWMQKQAGLYTAYLIATIIEKDVNGDLYDTAVVVGPEGLISRYRKMHLWAGEAKRFKRGNTLDIVELPFAKIGLQVCYEIGFPEQARVLTQAGAQIIVYSSAFAKTRAYVWDISSKSRALENGVFVLACNRTGVEYETTFGGLSRIVAPNSDVLAGTGTDGEAVICAELELDDIEKQRLRIPFLRDLNSKLVLKKF